VYILYSLISAMSDQQLFFHMMRQVVEALGLEPNFFGLS